MLSNDPPGDALLEDMRLLHAELGSARQRLAQRERALAELNRRLLVLERSTDGLSGGQRAQPSEVAAEEVPSPDLQALQGRIDGLLAENQSLRSQLRHEVAALAEKESWTAELEKQVDSLVADRDSLRAELDRLYGTRLFRWAAPARRAYSEIFLRR